MKQSRPSFLEDAPLTKQDEARLEKVMRNWMTVHAHIKMQPMTQSGVMELKRMMVYELETQRRLHILLRLRSRFNNLRIRAEDAEVLGVWQRGQ